MAVSLTLPHGIERTKAVRSGPTGSAIGTLGVEWQCHPHCHSTLNVWGRYAQARLAVRSVRSGASGSVIHTGPHVQARVAVSLTLPHGIERTKAVRSGPTGSAIGTLGVEWQCHPHCHSTLNVWGQYVQARVAVRSVRSGPSGSAGWGDLWICERYADVGAPRQGCAPNPARDGPLVSGRVSPCGKDGFLAGPADRCSVVSAGRLQCLSGRGHGAAPVGC